MSKLFEDFESVSSKAWKQKIQMDLKGADYNDTLIWNTPEGIDVKPFYHSDDFSEPFIPVPHHPASWKVTQSYYIDSVEIVNKLITDCLERGAEALYLTADETFDFRSLFDNLDLSGTSIYFNLRFLDAAFLKDLISYLNTKDSVVHYQLDLLGNLGRTGNWFVNKESDHQILEMVINENDDLNILGVDLSLFQNAGANIVQQLAYSLAQANEYMNHFSDNKSLKMTFKVAVGPNYFFEIAKIRALRKLYASLASEYGMNTECQILAIPSKRNMTLYDYNMNMLRTTTECMSAILGGANAVSNLAYDAIYHKSNEFGERISRNQLLILKSESYFDIVNNPADGTYYVEQLTEHIANKALELFKEIESSGGYLKQLFEGTIQRKIKESAAKEQQAFDEGQLVLIGTNKYPNPDDQMKENIEILPFVKIEPRKTLIEPIIEKRLSEALESERLEKE